MPDNSATKDSELIELLQTIVTNEWFLLFAGLASIISLAIALFAANKRKKIDKSIRQKQSGTGNIQAGRDAHSGKDTH